MQGTSAWAGQVRGAGTMMQGLSAWAGQVRGAGAPAARVRIGGLWQRPWLLVVGGLAHASADALGGARSCRAAAVPHSFHRCCLSPTQARTWSLTLMKLGATRRKLETMTRCVREALLITRACVLAWPQHMLHVAARPHARAPAPCALRLEQLLRRILAFPPPPLPHAPACCPLLPPAEGADARVRVSAAISGHGPT